MAKVGNEFLKWFTIVDVSHVKHNGNMSIIKRMKISSGIRRDPIVIISQEFYGISLNDIYQP